MSVSQVNEKAREQAVSQSVSQSVIQSVRQSEKKTKLDGVHARNTLSGYNNNNTLFKYRVQRVFEKEDHEVIPI